MKKIAYCGIVLLASLGSAYAADPLGEWTVADGVARIRIVDCNTRLWGVVAWEKQPGGLDTENPDPSKKNRPTLGMPILLNMKKALQSYRGDREQWEGKVYNAKNGKLYDTKIQLVAPDKLEIKGCVLGFLCGGETWTRYVDPSAPLTGSTQSNLNGMAGAKANIVKNKPLAVGGSIKGATPADPDTEVCLLPEIAGAPH